MQSHPVAWADFVQGRHGKALASEVVKAAEGVGTPATDDMFDYTFAEITRELEIQRRTHQTHSLGQRPQQAGLQAEMARH